MECNYRCSGFILSDLRTHETTFYKVSGATETAGKASIEGKIQQMGYTGDYPYLINVEGVPTYFSPLKDKKGLVKMYGFCSVQDYSIVGVGESVTEAKNNYIKSLQDQGNDLVIEKTDSYVTIEGTVDRIGLSVDGGTSYYTMVIKEIPDKLFVGSQSSLSNELPITQVGDKVRLEYNKSDSFLIDLMAFDNLMYTQTKSQAQLEKEQADSTNAEKISQ